MRTDRRTALLAIALFAFAALALQLRLPGAGLSGDEPEYAYLAGRLATGHGFTLGPSTEGRLPGGSFDPPGSDGRWYTAIDPDEAGPARATAWRQPGVPAVLALIDRVLPGELRSHVPATRRAFALLLALHAPLLVAIGALLGHRAAGAVAAVVWTLDPVSRSFAQHLLAEGLASLFVCAAVAALLQARRQVSTRHAATAWSVAAGVATGAAILTRGYLVVLLVLAALWTLAVRRPVFPRAAVVAFAVAAVVLPAGWVARNAVRMDSATLSTQTWEQVYVGNDALARGSWAGSRAARAERTRRVLAEDPGFFTRSEAGREAVLRRLAVDEVVDHPVRTLLRLPKKAAIVLLSPSSPYAGRDPLWFVAAGAAVLLLAVPTLRRRVAPADVALLLAPLAAVVVTSVVTFGESRFRVPAEGPVLVLGGVAAVTAARRLAASATRRPAAGVP